MSVLLSELESLHCDVGHLWDLVEFNAFAVQFRYDVMTTDEEELDRHEVISKVQAVFTLVQSKFDKD